MSMLPVGTYANEDGSESLGLALPGMLHEPLQALGRLFGTPSNPGTFGQGPDAPGNADDMRTLLMSMYGGNAMNPGRLLEGAAAKAALPEVDATTRALQDAATASKAERAFNKSIDSDWYHAAWPDFQQFNDPTDYLGVHVTRHRPTAADFQAERGGPLLRLDAPFEKPFTLPPYGSPGYAAALKEAQEVLPGFDGTKNALEQNAQSYRQALTQHGYDSIVSQDTRLLDDAFEAIALNPKALNETIYSDTGRPSLFGSSVAGAQAPQRMYHGTAAAEDFSHFRPSSEGSFGPGVYLSENPAIASQRALMDDGSRVFPVDAQGPFASMDDYLTALHGNGRDPSAAQRVLADQGYTGVSGDLGSYGHPAPVTNVFQPGSIRSATTGETLYSDVLPSVPGMTIAGASDQNTPNPIDMGRLAAIAFARQQRGGK